MDLGKNRKWLAIVHFMKPNDDTVYTTTIEADGTELCDAVDVVYGQATYYVNNATWSKFMVRSIELLENVT